MTGADLVSGVVVQAGIDAERSEALAWCKQAADELVGRSNWRKQRLSLGPTVAGTANYTVPAGVYQVLRLAVAGSGADGPYHRVGEDAIFDLASGVRSLSGSGGVFAPYNDTDASEDIQLWPVPTLNGGTITALCAMVAPTIADNNVELTFVPVEFGPTIRDKAIAIGLRLIDERLDLANNNEQLFEAKVMELTRLKNARITDKPQRMLRKGIDW